MSQRSKEYEILTKIGQGSFGTVFKVRRKSDRQILVMKLIKMQSLSKKNQQDSVSEVKILSSLNSPYIVKYFDSFVENSTLHIVMEYCEKGDLSQVMKKQQLSQSKIWKFFIQMCIGLEYLHSKQILHRDIKSLNIFLSNDDSIRIGDLGVAKLLSNTAGFAQTQVGSPYYLSPELCEEKPYNTKSDVWALGCVLYEMCALKHPFHAPNQAALILKIVKGTYQPLSLEFSENLKEVIELCLEKDYKKRPSITMLLQRNEIINMASSFNLLIPSTSVLNRIKGITDDFSNNLNNEFKRKTFMNQSVQAAKIVEAAQKQVEESRKAEKPRPFSAQRSENFSVNKIQKNLNENLNENLIFQKIQKNLNENFIKNLNENLKIQKNIHENLNKKDDSPRIKFMNPFLYKAGNGLGKNNFEGVLADKHSDREVLLGKKKSVSESFEKILIQKEQKSFRNLKNASPSKKDQVLIKENNRIQKIELKKNYIYENRIKKPGNCEKPSFKLNIKQNSPEINNEDQKLAYKPKIPISAKVAKSDFLYEDVKMVENLPEIPKIKKKLVVQYSVESSPIRSTKASIPKLSFKILKKPLIEPIFKQKFNTLTSKTLKTEEKYFEAKETDSSFNLQQKERESIQNGESLKKKCSELRRDVIQMVGSEVFDEMHKIFTRIITVKHK